jgi:DnaJ-class molecular chaperone
MAKLKVNNVRKLICPTCKGNGYLKVGTEWGETVHQCWDCDSEGEFYETSDNLIGDSDSDRNHDIKLH